MIASPSSVRAFLVRHGMPHSESVPPARPDSGHSNQQRSKDLNEEDFKDECKFPPFRSLAIMSSRTPASISLSTDLITIDDEIVIDNVRPLLSDPALRCVLKQHCRN